MINWLENLDRRWIFLLMALSVGVPILIQKTLPEAPTPLAQSTFDQLDQLPAGQPVALKVKGVGRGKRRGWREGRGLRLCATENSPC